MKLISPVSNKGSSPKSSGCVTAGDGHGCSQSRRAGSRGVVINRSVPGRKGMKNVAKQVHKGMKIKI
jgi:hypothetical protein